MVVCAEYLFVENMLVGWIILWLASKIGSLETNNIRLFLGSIAAGIMSFAVCAPDYGIVYSLVEKLVFLILLALITFPQKVIKAIIYVYVSSVAMGGIVISIIYISGKKGIVSFSGYYIEDLTYACIFFMVIVAFTFLFIFTRLNHNKKIRESIFVDATIKVQECEIKGKALVDTGNFLKEPLTGKSVILVKKYMCEELFETCKNTLDNKTCAIPFCSVGNEHGILMGYRAEDIYVDGKRIKKPIIAVIEEELYLGDYCDWDILISPELFEI